MTMAVSTNHTTHCKLDTGSWRAFRMRDAILMCTDVMRSPKGLWVLGTTQHPSNTWARAHWSFVLSV